MTTTTTAPRVLVVDDDETTRRRVVALLHDEGYEAVSGTATATALAMIVRHWWPDLILLTDVPGVAAAAAAEALGAVGFPQKPVEEDLLMTAVRRHLPSQPAPAGTSARP